MFHLKQIHGHMIRAGLMADRFPASRVLTFCALSDNGDMGYARRVFSQIYDRNVYIWNTMIRGFFRASSPEFGFDVFCEMIRGRVEVDGRTFVFALKACEQFLDPLWGEFVHSLLLKSGFAIELLVRNGLMHFYVKFGLLGAARLVFDESFDRDVVTWTTMIDGYSQNNMADEALKLFYHMLFANVEANEVTMITVLSACSQIGILVLGRCVHQYIEANIPNLSLNLLNALVDMHVKCGSLDIAWDTFNAMEYKDVFTWTTMINGYAKSGKMEIAKQLFDLMPERNVVSWNAMITGYSQLDQPKIALDMFNEMKQSGMRPSEDTLVTVLSVCSHLGRLDLGARIYDDYIGQMKIKFSLPVMNASIDMYGRCGNVDKAHELFCQMPKRDLVSWNCMIAVFAAHGYGMEAIHVFENMIFARMSPDDITFVGLLSACSRSGLVSEGRNYFENMERVYSIKPKVKHYSCMIDLLGRVGLLEEAYELITKMPTVPDKASWGALLNACKIHGYIDIAKRAGEKLIELDPNDSGIYVLLASVCAAGKRWDDVKMVRNMMRLNRIKKNPGCSLIEVNSRLHEFFVSDKSHPQQADIYSILHDIYVELNLEGYVPSCPC